MNFDKNTTEKQINDLETSAILAAFNKITGKSTKKFRSRSIGIAQLMTVLSAIPAKGVKKPSKNKTGAARKKPGMTFRLAPADEQKLAREGSKRGRVLAMLQRAKGALFSEICTEIGWEEKDAYEGIRLLNVFSGYGLYDDRIEKDGVVVDYRIRIVTADEFEKLVAADNEEEE